MFGDLVVGYLFLGGAGAGGCLVCAALGLLSDRRALAPALAARLQTDAGRAWSRFLAPPLAVSVGCLAVGIVCLAADLGRPDRLLLLMTAPSPTYLSVGAWALVACVALGGLLALAWGGLVPTRSGALAALGVATALAAGVTAVYAGLLLASMPSVPLWCTPWLPTLFALSALSCGAAVVLGMAELTGAGAPFSGALAALARVDLVVIALEAVALGGVVLSVWLGAGGDLAGLAQLGVAAPAAGGAAPAAGLAGVAVPEGATPTDVSALASAAALVAGPRAWALWGVAVGAGMLAPAVLDAVLLRDARRRARGLPALSPRGRALAAVASATCVLAGACVLRWLVVDAGLHPLLGGVL